MQSCRCEALVLGSMDYRETDRIVTLITPEHGKVRGIARGAKKSVRRFGASLELFARIQVEIVLREGLSSIHQADIISLYPSIRGDLTKIGLAGYACELNDAMLPEGMANPRLYRLLSSYLEQLDRAPATESDRRFFEINFLNVLGYRPAIDRCAVCSRPLEEGGWSIPSSAGDGLYCRLCARGGSRVSMETISLLKGALGTGRFGAITFPPGALTEAGRFLDGAIASHLHRPIKSLTFLREMVVP